MRQYQPLPVTVQDILAAGSRKLHAAARLSRFQQKVYFRVMAQRLKMSDAFCRISNRFFVYNISSSKFHQHPETFPDKACQDFQLYFSHQLCLDFLQLLVPYNMKLRFFFFQLAQLRQHGRSILPVRQDNLIGQHRF